MTITGGESPAVEAMREQTLRMMAGEPTATNVEMAHIMLAVNQVLTGITVMQARQDEIISHQSQLDAEIRRLREEQSAMKLAQATAADNVDPDQRRKAVAVLSNAVANRAQVIGARRESTAIALRAERQERIDWYGEPFGLNINGVRFHIVSGQNIVPVSVAHQIREKVRRDEELQARQNILSVQRRSNGKSTLSANQVAEGLFLVDKYYGSSPKLDERQAMALVKDAYR